MPRPNDEVDPVVQRLNVLIGLALDSLAAEGTMPMASKIRRLSDMGLASAEIARIVGKPINYVTSIISQRKLGAKP